MTLIPLDIPAGVYANGTDLQASGRWLDASLVRWTEGTMRPVGGWEARVQMGSTAPRAALGWADNAGDTWLAAGYHDALRVASGSGTVTDITPVGLVVGDLSAQVNIGYSGGFYGAGYYGTERPDIGNYGEATTWSLDTWGQELIACSNADGKIYAWDVNPLNKAVAVTNAPVNNLAAMVTEERFLFALGAGGDPRKVQWSDRENRTVWAPAATNEAGDILLQTSGQIMCGVRIRGQALILTDVDAHVATYQGPPFVYGFERIGTSCGVVSRKAVAVADEGAFWIGLRGFYRYAGGSVEELPCDVSDHVFGNLNRAQQSKIFALHNSQYGEIWWFYPDAYGHECNRYVTYSIKERHWSVGELGRSCGIDKGVFRRPIWFDGVGLAHNHEIGLNYDGATIFAETGPISLGNGDGVMKVTSLIPDEKTRGQCSATFKTRFHPNDFERTYGPYPMGTPSSVRFTGRQIRLRVEGARLADWRWGVPRIDAVQGGKR